MLPGRLLSNWRVNGVPTFRERPDLINRKGRPKKGQTLTDILEKHGSKKDVKNGDEYIARKEGLAQKLWALALGGDVAAIRYIYDRVDGRPIDKKELSGTDGGAIRVVATDHDEKL